MVELLIVDFYGKVKPIMFYVEDEGAFEFIESNYEEGKTTTLRGTLGASQVARIIEERSFKGTTEKTVYDLLSFRLVDDGEPEQYEDSADEKIKNKAFDVALIKKGLAERAVALEELKNGKDKGQATGAQKAGFKAGQATQKPASKMPATARTGW